MTRPFDVDLEAQREERMSRRRGTHRSAAESLSRVGTMVSHANTTFRKKGASNADRRKGYWEMGEQVASTVGGAVSAVSGVTGNQDSQFVAALVNTAGTVAPVIEGLVNAVQSGKVDNPVLLTSRAVELSASVASAALARYAPDATTASAATGIVQVVAGRVAEHADPEKHAIKDLYHQTRDYWSGERASSSRQPAAPARRSSPPTRAPQGVASIAALTSVSDAPRRSGGQDAGGSAAGRRDDSHAYSTATSLPTKKLAKRATR